VSTKTGTVPGESWRERAGLIVLDPNDPHGNPIPTPADRRWLWRIEGFLGVQATNDAQRQLAADLRAYLSETCGHHMTHHEGDETFAGHSQCLWCNYTVFTDSAETKGAA
jgi:hypothetical protein